MHGGGSSGAGHRCVRQLLALLPLLFAVLYLPTAAAQATVPCPHGRIVNVIAHADDDLYFINPDVAAAIDSAQCLLTVVVTGGYVDDADNAPRVAGLKAAYAQMAMHADDWQQEWTLIAGKPVERYTLRGRPDVALAFLHLPCGAHDALDSKTGVALHAVRAGARTASIGPRAGVPYDNADIVAVLRALLLEIPVVRVNTLDPDVAVPVRHTDADGEGSHPDHAAVGQLTREAVAGLQNPPPVWAYLDYPSQNRPVNLPPAEAKAKHLSMSVYCQGDRRACNVAAMQVVDCPVNGVEWGEAWLCRRYLRPLPLQAPDSR